MHNATAWRELDRTSVRVPTRNLSVNAHANVTVVFGSPTRAQQSHDATARAVVSRGFWSGLRYPWRGARFVYVEHPELARFWIPPIVITFCLLVVAGFLAIDLHGDVTEWLWSAPAGSGWLDGAARLAHRLLGWLVALLMLVLAVVLVALCSSVIAAPFNDALSEAVESVYLARSPLPFSVARLVRDLVRTVGLELLKLLVYAAVMLPLFAIGLLAPVIGPVLQAVIGSGCTALFFALDHVDWSASRHGLSARQRIGWAFAHFRPMLGLGTGVWLLLLVPLLNLLFMPAAVAGGTLLFLDLAAGRAPSTPDAPRVKS
jgi:CysZ protein